MNKIDYFKEEYKFIKNERLKDNLKILVDLLPDYFFKVPASSTGKYHPSFSLGEGGLVRHSKVAFRIGKELLSTNTFNSDFNQDECDLLLMSILIHDGLKHGTMESNYTKFEHPMLMANFIKDNKDKLTLNESEINFMADVISSHMGEWNTNKYSKVTLPIPITKYQKFVHLCDFLTSKKFLDVKFENNDIIDRE